MSLVAVAVSGGRDSIALLHCSLRSARSLGIQVLALHVHHGLQREGDDWLAQVRQQARRWGAGFDCRRLAGAPAAGDSIEAWARRGRYAALADMARSAGAGLVLLAHHRRDQAETWLLQALRGGGPAGLSAMPALAQRQGLVWARPWLDQPREAIDAYIRRHRLCAVEDPSNADPRLARGRLRTCVWPALQAAFPDAEQALAASSRHAQEAAALAAEAAALDLPVCVAGQQLQTAPWLQLPPARRANALRHWLAQASGAPVPESLVQRLLHDLPVLRSARYPAAQGQWCLYRGGLSLQALPPAAAKPRLPSAAPGPVDALDLARPGRHPVPGWAGVIEVQPCLSGGVDAELLASVLPRPRSGSERFQRAVGTPPRSLKKQSQGLAVPAWLRQGPLLFTCGGDLLFVPWLGLDARCLAAPGQRQFSLAWQPATAAGQAAL